MKRKTLVLELMLLVLVAACSQPAAPKKSALSPAAATQEPVLVVAPPRAPTPEGKIDVYLMPLDDFDFRYTSMLAQTLGKELGLTIKPTVNVGCSGLRLIPGTRQYDTVEIGHLVCRAATNLPDTYPKTAFIALTQRDLNDKDLALRFYFSAHDPATRFSVVSSARLVWGPIGGLADPETIRTRMLKMVKRSIGIVFYGVPKSTELRDVMYSPIMSLEDVDRMGTNFLAGAEMK